MQSAAATQAHITTERASERLRVEIARLIWRCSEWQPLRDAIDQRVALSRASYWRIHRALCYIADPADTMSAAA